MAFRWACLSASPFDKNTSRASHRDSVPAKGYDLRRTAPASRKLPGSTWRGRLSCSRPPAKKPYLHVKYSPEIPRGPSSRPLRVSLGTPGEVDLARVLIVTKAKKYGLAKFVILRQLLIGDLRNKFRRQISDILRSGWVNQVRPFANERP